MNLSKGFVNSFSNNLISWYRINKRDLPWRNTKDPYKIWLSEIILQQTKIAQGLPYYNRFIKKYPNVQVLAGASEKEVLKLWEGLGYYSRARNLHKTAKIIVTNLEGIFPSTYKNLIKLPGIGDYTASAISSFSINEINPVIDGNVYRFLSRLLGILIPINTNKSLKEFRNIAKILISKKNPSDFNQAIMEFGSLVCKPKNPICNECIYQKSCFAYLNQKTLTLPLKNSKKKVKERFLNFLIIKSPDGNTVIEKRINKDIWQNLYQFPLIESEKPLDKKNLSIKLKEIQYLNSKDIEFYLYQNKSFSHKLTHQNIHSSFWIFDVKKIKNNQTNIRNLDMYPFPKPISNFLLNYNW
ncbi:MAG: A/G-specific adenine glycosylase [Flavobacteriaceae bacterium]|nr:A/G-specific adenine glycosylase [Flavobacteriaceae bacterium]MBT4959370.1 A/G-specific adenine glycosylase [Flavobacteriaceae bacterium]MBT6447926.1 A/G-specific adenine glycosylase [Flavobacteriaceae bacterium]MBT7624103.1 A/G-specific adenine glycosylase [Flavobacteriaceae bacterium]MDG1830512.1 A/G-specific adenine glycosylase [Flavobacteriaceae bacterium]